MADQLLEAQLRTQIDEATAFLSGKLRRTPVEQAPKLTKLLGVPVWLKLESLQLTGSFKIRGAWYRLSCLTAAERESGVFTCSAGNHGKAVAYAAKGLGVHATICVPSSVDKAKYEGMVAYGAEVRVSQFPGYDDTQSWAEDEARKEGKPFISPFDEVPIMAGNGGSLAAEVLEDVRDAHTFILPVGGGSLSAGFSFYAKERDPAAVIVGCQHVLSPGLRLSLEAGRAITKLPAVETVAGGVEGGLGKLTFEILRTRVDRVALVSEEEIYAATRWMLEEHQYLVEPSAAVTVAACLSGKTGHLDTPAVVVLSGRNVSVSVVRRILGECG